MSEIDENFLLDHAEEDSTDEDGSSTREHLQRQFTGYDEHLKSNTDSTDDIDPENNFYNNININCEYYTEEGFNNNIKIEDGLSIIHFNSRSLYTKLQQIKDYLCKFKKIYVIAVSETWLDEEKVNDMKIEGYELFTTNRVGKTGGGVALYIDTELRCSVLKSMSKTIENIMECVTVEIKVDKTSNIIISCVYRTPGTSVDIFNEHLASMWDKVNDSKVKIICGDINVDLLKMNNKTTGFINTMYSNNLFPLITKPSRITTETATLIDNIFTNKIELNIKAGLLLHDLSDHLPVFAVLQNVLRIKKEKKSNTCYFTRHRTPETIAALELDLINQNWNEVYTSSDPNQVYDIFQSKLMVSYDKHCPLRKHTSKSHLVEKPWITRGIEKACKKKNVLYRRFLKLRTKEAENKYKLYKNKLTSIMRLNKKDYFHKLLEQNKSNTQGIWKVLNNIIKNGAGKVEIPNNFVKDEP